MKIPILTLLPKHSAELLNSSISAYLDTCKACTEFNTDCSTTLQQALYSMCYKIFFYTGRFSVNSRYTISDACIYVPGMFKLEMIRFMTNVIKYCNTKESKDLEILLSDCLSYELMQMLYFDPVRLYAALLYVYGKFILDDELIELGKYYLAVNSTQPTLDWECMYLKFMERIEQ